MHTLPWRGKREYYLLVRSDVDLCRGTEIGLTAVNKGLGAMQFKDGCLFEEDIGLKKHWGQDSRQLVEDSQHKEL